MLAPRPPGRITIQGVPVRHPLAALVRSLADGVVALVFFGALVCILAVWSLRR